MNVRPNSTKIDQIAVRDVKNMAWGASEVEINCTYPHKRTAPATVTRGNMERKTTKIGRIGVCPLDCGSNAPIEP